MKKWPPSLDLNPTENLCSFGKIILFDGGKYDSSKEDLWEVIITTMSET